MILALYLSNASNKKLLIEQITKEDLLSLYINLTGLHGLLHSTLVIDKLIDEEYRLDRFPIQTNENTIRGILIIE